MAVDAIIKGFEDSTFRDLHPCAFEELKKYREDMAHSIAKTYRKPLRKARDSRVPDLRTMERKLERIINFSDQCMVSEGEIEFGEVAATLISILQGEE
jgi:hypothetical protein